MDLNIEELKLIVVNQSASKIGEALAHFNIASFDKNGNNILHFFIKSDASLAVNAENIVQLFIYAGIDINAKQEKMPMRTALQLVVLKRLKNIFYLLLREGAKVDLQDGDGNGALFQAVMNYKNDDSCFIETLISHGARIDLANKYDVTPKSLSDTMANFNSNFFFAK